MKTRKPLSLIMVISMLFAFLTVPSVVLAETEITLEYGDFYKAENITVISQNVSNEGTAIGDTAVVELTQDGRLKATGLGTATVSINGTETTVTVTKADIALVMIAGQSNAAGAEGSWLTAPSAVGEYEGKFFITNSGNSSLPISDVTLRNAKLSAENGGKCEDGKVPTNHELYNRSAGTACALARKLVDLWDMKVWVVNTALGGSPMELWVPGAQLSNKFLQYAAAAKAELANDGHYIMDESKLGYLWLQGCSNGINVSKYNNTYEWYISSFTAMHELFKKEAGMNYGAIWMVRAGVYGDNRPEDFYMSGPRLAQYYLTNSTEYPDISLILNTDIFRYDADVKAHFENKYGTNEAFVERFGYDMPQTLYGMKPTIHYNQFGYNEVGDEGAINLDKIMRGDYEVTTAKLMDYYGNPYSEKIELEAGESVMVVPVVSNINFNPSAGVVMKVEDERIATVDNETFTLTTKSDGTTKINLCIGEKCLNSYTLVVGNGVYVDGFELPANAVVQHHEHLGDYTEGSINGQGNWKSTAGVVEVVANAKGLNRNVVVVNSLSEAAEYALDEENQLDAPFIVTARFWHPGPTADGMTYGINYTSGKQDFIASNNGNVNSGYFQLRANVSGTQFQNYNAGVPTSEGWHELAVVADTNRKVSYYVDGAPLTNSGVKIEQDIPEGVKVKGVFLRDANWHHPVSEGYLADIKFYDIRYIKKLEIGSVAAEVDDHEDTISVTVQDFVKTVADFELYDEGASLSINQGDLIEDGQVITYTDDTITKNYTVNITVVPFETIDVPDGLSLIYHENLAGLTEGKINGQGGWTTTSGEATVVKDLKGFDGNVVYTDTHNEDATFTLSEADYLSAPFMVTSKFWHPGRVADGMTYGINYTNEKQDFISSNCSGVNTGYFQLRANVTGTQFQNYNAGVATSYGWHELAIMADETGVVTYYVDGKPLTNGGEQVKQQLPEGVKVKGAFLRDADWGHPLMEGYLTDIKFYGTRNFDAFVIGDTYAVVDDEAGTVSATVYDCMSREIDYTLSHSQATVSLEKGSAASDGQTFTYTNGDVTKTYTIKLNVIPLPGKEISEGLSLKHNETFAELEEGDINGQDNWTVTNGSFEVAENAKGYNGKVLVMNANQNGANESGVFTLDADKYLSAPFTVTAKFWHPGSIADGATYGVDYTNGNQDFIASYIGTVNRGEFQLRADVTGERLQVLDAGVTTSEGWHEFAVSADENGVISYYIDGEPLTLNGTQIKQQLPEGVQVKGFTFRNANWGYPDYTAYLADIRFYGKEEAVLRGDADGNGKIAVADAVKILKYVARVIGTDEIVTESADVDGDGKIGVLDATAVLRYIARLTDKL